jgi:hypothetical protein
MNKFTCLHFFLRSVFLLFLYFSTQNTYAKQNTHINLAELENIPHTETLCFNNFQVEDSLPKKRFCPIYLDVSVGVFPTFLTDVNLGYRFNETFATGVSAINWSELDEYKYAKGVGGQLRVTLYKKLVLKCEYGYLYRSVYNDDGNYITRLNREKSNKTYFRLSAGVCEGFFTAGLAYVSTNGQINDTYTYSTQEFIKSYNFSINCLTLYLGVVMPRIRSSKSLFVKN